jgi:subtilase family serine protease
MQKLKTALFGAAMVGCAFATAALASPHNIGTLFATGVAPAAQQIHFDVFLPLRHKDQLEKLLEAQQNPSSPQYHKWLTPAQFSTKFGPDRATMASVANALRGRGFAVESHSRTLHVTGTVDLVNRSFGVQLMTARSTPGTSHIVTNERLVMPKELAAAGAQVFSFAPHAAIPSARSTGKIDEKARKGGSADNRYSDTGPYWFTDLKQAYHYPSYQATVDVHGTTERLDGKGTIIGALMSSDILDSDVQALFDHEHWTDITGQPAPKLAARVNIDGGAPFDVNSGASFEASLDVQQELTSAPGSIVLLYNIPSLSDANVMAGYTRAVEDNLVDVLSSSFGECELFYFPGYNNGQSYTGILQAEHELFAQGNSQGMTFLASSGDSAGLQCPSRSYFTGGPARFRPGLQTPASDPNVTAVGGTNLVTAFDGTLNSRYVTENGWADPEVPYDPYGVGVNVRGGYWGAGSGYSKLWPAPSYQTAVATGSNMRAVPDIGMQVGGCPGGIAKLHKGECNGGNDPNNGSGNTQRSAAVVAFGVGQGGGFYGVIGTSVSSPELGGVVAQIVQQKGRMGNFNHYIYRLAAEQAASGKKYFHVNVPGFNGIEQTDLNSSYSLSNGVGTPIVKNFIGQRGVQKAGRPQTSSNP